MDEVADQWLLENFLAVMTKLGVQLTPDQLLTVSDSLKGLGWDFADARAALDLGRL